MKTVLDKYVNNLTATHATNQQLSTVLQETVGNISPARDIARLRPLAAKGLAAAKPKRIMYYNYHVGECRDMLFGVGLVDYASSRGLKDGELPKIVGLCIKEVEERGLKNEGIYRVCTFASLFLVKLISSQISGRHATVVEVCFCRL